MTLVRIALDVPGPAGDVRATGRVRATPTLRRTVGDAVVLPAAFSAALVAGVVTVELAPSGVDWCWRIEELTGAGATRYVAVPDSATTLGYEDLVDVDPDTLDPAVEPEAAWTVALAAALTTVVHSVGVDTGSEARPDTTAMVVWYDNRVDQSTPPTNIVQGDAWLTGVVPDVTNPTAPSNLAPSAITDTSFTVTWDAGTDEVGVTGYDWRVDGGAATTVAATPRSLDFTGLTASTAYTVEIRSRDAAGNVSAYVPLEVTTAAAATTFTVFGASAPTGSWSLGTDGTPTIMFGRGFYKFNSADPTNGLPTGRVVGGRVWIPVGATGLPTEATFYLFGPNVDLDSAPVQTKVVSLAGATAGSWVAATFDAATDLGADGDVWMIGVEFTGGADAGKYVFGTATRTNTESVTSLSGKNFAWTEAEGANVNLSSRFKIGAGADSNPGDATQSYGVDIVLDAGA